MLAHESFRRFSQKVSQWTGSPLAFGLALSSVVVWALLGPAFRFSENWQLVINTGTTIVTFLMVFLIQNAQNRDTRALHLKIDELIRAIKNARNELIDLEDMTDQELDELQKEFQRLHRRFVAEECQDGQIREVSEAHPDPAHRGPKKPKP